MTQLRRTNSADKDFINLVVLLDADLAIRDGKDRDFYAQYNKIDQIKYVIIAYEKEQPIGCGAIKFFDKNTMEVKRMYVTPEGRRKGVASKILSALEDWTKELEFQKCTLETGYKQPEAIAMYTKHGYKKIPNYGQYIGIKNSVCFEKIVKRND